MALSRANVREASTCLVITDEATVTALVVMGIPGIARASR